MPFCPLCDRHLGSVLEYPHEGSSDVSRTPDLLPINDPSFIHSNMYPLFNNQIKKSVISGIRFSYIHVPIIVVYQSSRCHWIMCTLANSTEAVLTTFSLHLLQLIIKKKFNHVMLYGSMIVRVCMPILASILFVVFWWLIF